MRQSPGGGEEGYSQNDKLARPHGQNREEEEADDEAGRCAQVAAREDQQPVPPTHYDHGRDTSFVSIVSFSVRYQEMVTSCSCAGPRDTWSLGTTTCAVEGPGDL